jgi:hypothetical protein
VIVKMIVESRWNVDWQGKPKFSEKTCPSATFVHHKIPCQRVTRTTEARINIWKGAAIQRGSEHESKIIAIVRSRYQATTSEDTAGWKSLSV